MKIIVTGALGHIGSYLIRYLTAQFPQANIVMIDNMMTNRYASLFNLPIIGKYKFIEGDVTTLELEPLLDDASVLVHLAAITDASGTIDKADALEANNFQSTKKVADACRKTGTRLIAISSTSVYGTQNSIVSEDCKPDELNPQSPYAETKLKEEEYILNLSKNMGLRAISCRFGTIFGASPGMRFHTAVNKFCWQAAMDMPISIWKTAYDQKRPYLDLQDAARAISFIIQEDIFDGEIYNVLTENITVRQVVEVINEFIPNLKIEYVDSRIMNQLSYIVSCQKFMDKGFIFSGSLKRGIGETISLIKNMNSLKK